MDATKSKKSFKNPPVGVRPVSFWFWNDHLEPKRLAWQLRRLLEAGQGGAHHDEIAYAPELHRQYAADRTGGGDGTSRAEHPRHAAQSRRDVTVRGLDCLQIQHLSDSMQRFDFNADPDFETDSVLSRNFLPIKRAILRSSFSIDEAPPRAC